MGVAMVLENLIPIGIGVLSILGIAVLVNAIMKIGDFLSGYFKTNKSCQECQSRCRKEIYAEIHKKADLTDMKDLDKKLDAFKDYQIQIIESIAKLTVKVDMLINGNQKFRSTARQAKCKK